MPLKAKINGQLIYAPLMSLDEWDALQMQKPNIEMCCCETRGYMRVTMGTRHFVHFERSPDCIWKPESPEHQMLKTLVMRTVADTGWNADLEVAGPDRKWIADVFATKNRAKLAFEIQLSPITHDELLRRHRAYIHCGVRDCWFVKGPVGRDYIRDPTKSAPVFLLTEVPDAPNESEGFKVSLTSRHHLPIEDAVRALLGRQFQWCARKRIRRREWVEIVQIPHCWFCRKAFHTYLLEASSIRCGGEPKRDAYIDKWSLMEPRVADAVDSFLTEQARNTYAVAFPFLRRDPASGDSELAFSCSHCGGEYSWVHHQWFWRNHCEPLACIPLASEDRWTDDPHWCYSAEHDFCC